MARFRPGRIAKQIVRAVALAPLLVLANFAHGQMAPDEARNEAFEVAQRAMSTSAGSALAQLGVRFAAGSDDLAALVRKRQDQLEVWKGEDRRLAQALAAGGRANDERMADLRARMLAAQEAISQADKELATRFPAYAELAQPRPLALMEAQSLLGGDEALVMIFSAERETFIWAISRAGSTWKRVERPKKDFIEDIRRLRDGLNPSAPAVFRSAFGESIVEGGETIERPRFDRDLAYRLWTDLLAPVQDIIGSATRLFIVAEAPFDSLPFNLLVTSQPSGDDRDPDALRVTDWLIRKHALVTLPTAASLRALRSAQQVARAPEPFRGYGAPLFSGSVQVASLRSAGTAASVFEAGRVSLDAVRGLAPLPQTEGELLQLAKVLAAPPTSLRLGAQATEAAVKGDDLSRYRVIAFATHGLATSDDDGLLTASEAARLNLNADWVILSACNTASGDGTPGASGLSGLARAFFYAGAKTLLVSHWPVRDDAAARLTSQTFVALSRDSTLGKANAFRQSVLALLADESDPALAHPAIWAPFVVVGEGR
jgi:CHAT domain-containing protein